MHIAIRTRGLTKLYGATVGVDDLDLDVAAGEVFGFLGPNGAGKTTTIRLLVDLIRPTRGRAEICGLDTRRDSLEVRRRIGYLPGDLRPSERHTGAALLAHLSRLRGDAGAGAIRPLADRLGLDLTRRIGELSKGNRQKVGIVAAFMHDPAVLILDEPTSGLDPLRQRDVMELIRERAAGGATVLLSSHELGQVEHVAVRVGVLRGGRLIALEEIAGLRRRAVRRVEVGFDGPVADSGALRRVPGLRNLTVEGGTARFDFEGAMSPLIRALSGMPVGTLTSEAPELDEVFRAYYDHAA